MVTTEPVTQSQLWQNPSVPSQEDVVTVFKELFPSRRITDLGEWSVESLLDGPPTSESTAELIRVRGCLPDGTEWSAIRKSLHWKPGNDPRWAADRQFLDPYYWKRELLAMAGLPDRRDTTKTTLLSPNGSGLLSQIEDVRVPRLLGFTIGNWKASIWMEDVAGLPAAEWTNDHFALAASSMGRLQGRYIDFTPTRQEQWLCQNWMRSFTYRADGAVSREVKAALGDPKTWNEGFASNWGRPLQRAFSHLWRERDRHLAIFEAATKVHPTLAHHDLTQLNVFYTDERIAVIDWSFVGAGPLGFDIGMVASERATDLREPMDQVRARLAEMRDVYLQSVIETAGDLPHMEHATDIGIAAGLIGRAISKPPKLLKFLKSGESFETEMERLGLTSKAELEARIHALVEMMVDYAQISSSAGNAMQRVKPDCFASQTPAPSSSFSLRNNL